MIVILEQDTRRYDGKRFAWKPFVWRGVFQGKPCSRYCWGLWSISFYRSPGLRDFFRHVESGETEWVMPENPTGMVGRRKPSPPDQPIGQ